VALCPITRCPLWPYRRGTNPFRVKPALTPEQKAALTARLAGRRES
jgi:Spy/CpxP family protein refolding chaperone